MGHLLKIKCVDSRAHFSCNKCPIYTLDGASAKFDTNSHGTDNSTVECVGILLQEIYLGERLIGTMGKGVGAGGEERGKAVGRRGFRS
jgi:hypothetical protein